MRVFHTIAAAGLCFVGVVGCNNFLNSEKATADPNNPVVATRNQLFVGVQANVFGLQEGPVEMIACEWMQQCAGINGRFVDQQGVYSITPGSFDIPFSNLYVAGGLIQIRRVKALADSATPKDLPMKGMTEVLEAMTMLFGTDVWGDLPYREATSDNATPHFDPQQQIYADLLTLLNQAITDLSAAGQPAKPELDLVYGGNKAYWIEAAHTLKARIYLHRVEKLGNGEYTNALAEARQGISAPLHDWQTLHGNSITTEKNMWWQFQQSSFGADLVAGSTLVNAMEAQSDPRIPDYFGENNNGGYGGYDVATQATPVDDISPIAGSTRADDPTFRQPIITYDETQLIIAEAAFKTGDLVSAAAALKNVRDRYGKSVIAAPTLADIMTEKYIDLFQNYEVWNDYKRTCLPVLTPARGRTVIPGRLYYGQTEEQTNPNTPRSDQQNLTTVRNWNDPAACT
jgi:starch-binding outer membrane protein, SusD/RagB family